METITTSTIMLNGKKTTATIKSTKGYITEINIKFLDNPTVEFTKYSDDRCSLSCYDNGKLIQRISFNNLNSLELFVIDNFSSDVLTFHNISLANFSTLIDINTMKELKEALSQINIKMQD